VKERLGHLKLSTTERYLHTLPTADETALTALDKIRSSTKRELPTEQPLDDQLTEANEEIGRLRSLIADLTIAQHATNDRRLRPA
jgi:hypothetical protein